MKIQNKAFLIISVSGLISLILLGTILNYQNNQNLKDKKIESIEQISLDLSSHLN